ncbi:hypothetical protein DERF_015810 [Dermatophagoides farinae]|uniref:Uncharacterized protein n=1 Tax=Dermatophagoides farinae TaxID=6954 RepID=A0A922HF91_DERFA|nr:hypothetical protein DERF_015810 [Dermatophagoides farinae]
MKIFQPFFGWLVEFKTATNRSKGGAEGGACHFLFFVFARNLNSFTNNIYTVHRKSNENLIENLRRKQSPIVAGACALAVVTVKLYSATVL